MSEQSKQEMFKLVSSYKPTGDQPEAIAKLVEGLNRGDKEQTLLGVTGSGKTFTMANVIQRVQRPTLVLAHNKTLAAQLCSEFREFFPESAVEYFVSYYTLTRKWVFFNAFWYVFVLFCMSKMDCTTLHGKSNIRRTGDLSCTRVGKDFLFAWMIRRENSLGNKSK